MSSPTEGAWECRHGVDGRDWCEECEKPAAPSSGEPEFNPHYAMSPIKAPSSERPDNKGYSEETCVRCGWRMGGPPLNCQNDDTPHRFPSQGGVTERPDIERLANTVRDQLADEHHPEEQDDCPFCQAVAALDELVALARERLRAVSDRDGFKSLRDEQRERAEAAEARVAELEAALRDAAVLLRQTTYNVPGWTGPDVWWKAESDELLARIAALFGAGGSG